MNIFFIFYFFLTCSQACLFSRGEGSLAIANSSATQISDLRQKLSASQEENTALKNRIKELEELSKKQADSSLETDKLQKLLDETKAELENQKKITNALPNSSPDNQAQTKAMEDKVANLNEQLKQKDSKISELQSELKQKMDSPTISQNQPDQSKIADLEKEVKTLKENLTAKESELDALKKQIQNEKEQSDEQTKDLNNQVSKLTDESSKLKDEIAQLSREKEDLQSQQASLEASLDQATNSVTQPNDQAKEELGQIDSETSKMLDELSESLSKVLANLPTTDNLETQISNFSKKSETSIKALQKELAEKESLLKESLDKINNQTTALKSLQSLQDEKYQQENMNVSFLKNTTIQGLAETMEMLKEVDNSISDFSTKTIAAINFFQTQGSTAAANTLDLIDKIRALENANDASNQQVQTLTENLSNLESQQNVILPLLEDIPLSLKETFEVIQALKSSSESITTSYKTKSNEWDSIFAKQQLSIADYENKLRQSQYKINELETYLSQHQDEKGDALNQSLQLKILFKKNILEAQDLIYDLNQTWQVLYQKFYTKLQEQSLSKNEVLHLRKTTSSLKKNTHKILSIVQKSLRDVLFQIQSVQKNLPALVNLLKQSFRKILQTKLLEQEKIYAAERASNLNQNKILLSSLKPQVDNILAYLNICESGIMELKYQNQMLNASLSQATTIENNDSFDQEEVNAAIEEYETNRQNLSRIQSKLQRLMS